MQMEGIHENELNLFLKGMFVLRKVNVLAYANGLGSHLRILFTKFHYEELRETLLQSVAKLIVNLADSFQSIEPERCENDLSADTLSPCLPLAFLVMSPSHSDDLAMRFLSRLGIHLTENEIDALEMEQKYLREAYFNEPILKAALDGMGVSPSFENSWQVFGNRFP